MIQTMIKFSRTLVCPSIIFQKIYIYIYIKSSIKYCQNPEKLSKIRTTNGEPVSNSFFILMTPETIRKINVTCV